MSGAFFFPSDTLIYGISRGGSKNVNIRTREHMILGQLRMGARQAKNAPLLCGTMWWFCPQISIKYAHSFGPNSCPLGCFTIKICQLYCLCVSKQKLIHDFPRYMGAIEQVVFRKTSNRWVTFIPNFGKGVGKVALFKMQLLHTSPKDLLDLHKLHTFPSHP